MAPQGSPGSSDGGKTQHTDAKEITYDGRVYKIVREGSAEILNLQQPLDPKFAKDGPGSQSVFYNPIQQYNRDLSVLAIKAFGEDLAAIRKARHQRRVKRANKDVQKSNKRKRPQEESKNEADDLPPMLKKLKEEVSPKVLKVLDPNTTSDTAKIDAENGEAPTIHEPVSAGIEAPRGLANVPGTTNHDQHNKKEDNAQVEIADEVPETLHSARTASFRILDALSATGLRAVRYGKEIPMATSITANDLSPSATRAIALNVKHNRLSEKIDPITSNAIEHMHIIASGGNGSCGHYHVIDLDPYGTAAPFLDSAVQAITDGGLLCVTCTDAGVFASLGYLEKTYSQYGGLPLKGAHAHEGGLRLILHAIATTAARYGISIEPLLSLSIDFYARVFVRVHRSPAEVKFLASKTMVVYNCDAGCGAWSVDYLARVKEKKAKNGDTLYNFTSALAPSAHTHCEHCGFKTHLAGPMWGGPLHNPHFIRRILDMLPTLDNSIYGTIPRMEGMLSIALDESIDKSPHPPAALDRPVPPLPPATRSHHPFFFNPSTLSRVLHCVSPSDAALRGALIHLGYRTTRSHTKAGSICTNAPWDVIWEVMREWVRQKSPVKGELFTKGTAGWGIMQKDRSRIKLREAQRLLNAAVNDSDIQNENSLREKVEAALYRLSKKVQQEGQPDTGAARDAENLHAERERQVLDSNGIKHTNGDRKETSSETNYEKNRDVSTESSKKSATEGTFKELHLSMLEIVFDEKLGKEPPSKRMVKYQQNPRSDWGPMNRAKRD